MIFDATTRKLQVVLAGAKATNDCPVTVDYVDVTATSMTAGFTPTNTNGVTAVDVLAAPAASTQRKVNGITLYNADTASITATVRYNDNATLYTLWKGTLAVGDTLNFTDTAGFFVVDASGNLKASGSGGTGRYIKSTVLTSGTSFTTQANTNTIFIRVQAGGGGGGGTTTVAVSGAVGGGGAAGGYTEKTFAVTPNTAYTYAIGAAGAAGAATGGNGGVGGISTFAVGATTVTANGGLGGIGEAAGTALAVVLGGASPAISTNGDMNSGGAPGGYGVRLSGLIGSSGSGGSCIFGAGGNATNAQGAGTAGIGNGAGGSGGCTLNGGVAVVGGAGLAGIIVVDEFS